jgi:ZIP family zinc transporter
MAVDAFVGVAGDDPAVQALLGGVVIAALNTVGALLVFVYPDPSERVLDGALGFAAGVMLSASYTSLLLPGIEFATDPGYEAFSPLGVPLVGLVPVVLGFAGGAVLLDRSEEWVPEVGAVITGRRPSADEEGDRIAGVMLFVAAITLHNVPEGLAVGVAFGAGDPAGAVALMLAIGAQNVPEGLAVSVAARNAGLGSRFYAGIAGMRAGAVEVPVAVLGAVAVTVAAPLLPYAMGFAAGGMLFVISHEIVPQTHSRGHEHVATMGLLAGALVMLTLDVALAA